MSFLKMEANNRLGKGNKLLKLSRIINWERVGKRLNNLYAYEINGAGGQEPYDSLKMFKAILLGQWYTLSDPGLEESLRVRLDFMIFTGLEGEIPDETTLCRFRNLLMEKGLYESLLEEINRSIEEAGLKVTACKGAVIDATIIESASRPKKTIEIMPEDREEGEDEDGKKEKLEETDSGVKTAVEYSKDPDARWLKKGKRSYFGYKGFIATDVEDGYIERVKITPANRSEVKEMESMIPERMPKRIYADKGYASKENRELLRGKNIRDGIMEKGGRNKPLGYWQRVKNRLISGMRFIVEQGFGTVKRRFKFERASYIRREKVEAQFMLKAMCFNLLKAINKAELVLN